MAETATITDLRTLMGDTDTEAEIWSDAQLNLFIDMGYSEYTYGQRAEVAAAPLTAGTPDDRTQALKLAKVQAYEALHRDTVLFFKWKNQQKEIDRTMTPESCRLMAKDIWAQVNAHRTSKEGLVGEEATAKPQGTNMQMVIPDRTAPRPWGSS